MSKVSIKCVQILRGSRSVRISKCMRTYTPVTRIGRDAHAITRAVMPAPDTIIIDSSDDDDETQYIVPPTPAIYQGTEIPVLTENTLTEPSMLETMPDMPLLSPDISELENVDSDQRSVLSDTVVDESSDNNPFSQYAQTWPEENILDAEEDICLSDLELLSLDISTNSVPVRCSNGELFFMPTMYVPADSLISCTTLESSDNLKIVIGVNPYNDFKIDVKVVSGRQQVFIDDCVGVADRLRYMAGQLKARINGNEVIHTVGAVDMHYVGQYNIKLCRKPNFILVKEHNVNNIIVLLDYAGTLRARLQQLVPDLQTLYRQLLQECAKSEIATNKTRLFRDA